jgi:hypothetical protein
LIFDKQRHGFLLPQLVAASSRHRLQTAHAAAIASRRQCLSCKYTRRCWPPCAAKLGVVCCKWKPPQLPFAAKPTQMLQRHSSAGRLCCKPTPPELRSLMVQMHYAPSRRCSKETHCSLAVVAVKVGSRRCKA